MSSNQPKEHHPVEIRQPPDPGLLEEVREAGRAYAQAVKRLEAAQLRRDTAWQRAWDAGWSFSRIGEASKTPLRTVQWTLRQKNKGDSD
jgi:hypothetical protein